MDDDPRFTRIAGAFQLATLLEVSAEKPGNVSPGHDFADTSYEDFLAACAALRPTWEQAVRKGFSARTEEREYSTIGVGSLIEDGVMRAKNAHSGGNTHLGTVMLLAPLAAGAGLSLALDGNLDNLRVATKNVLQHTTADDAVALYRAVNRAGAGGMGSEAELDVEADESIRVIREKEIAFLAIMRRSAKKDAVAREIANYYPITFDETAPLLAKLAGQSDTLRTAIAQTFLIMLSRRPDTLIERKKGVQKAAEVRDQAKQALEKGGILTPEGCTAVDNLHQRLSESGDNTLNPGTTADLLTTATAVYLLTR